ncbi:MAG: hypothetical protein J6P66_09180 [Bacteroidaceae bacterium]|nr:hypothetical protein [Bacteroidaceae bacterium]
MKKILYIIALILSLGINAHAQEIETISLRVPEFARQLVEKWAHDYEQHHASVNFEFVKGKAQDSNANVLELTTDAEAVSFARYAILPVTIKGSEAARLTSHRLNAKKLRSLFFVNDDDDEDEESKAEQKIHIYTGNSQLSASRAYASYLNEEVSDYKGRKISGDDSFLTTAISRDPLGVTVNYLSNIFDLESRQPGSSMALLPLDLDKHGRQVLDDANLDEIIRLLEEQRYDVIPVGTVGFMYDHTDSAMNDFVNWVLTAGVCELHRYGMLTLSQKELTAQMQRIASKELAQK